MSAQRSNSVSDVSFKLLVLGDHSVGKTCLVERYVKGHVSAHPRSTVAVDTFHKKTKIDGVNLDLHIWDTAGQERYRALTSRYYREAKGALLVFDITREDTLVHLKKYWIGEALTLSSREVVCLLVGSKSDRNDIRAVSDQAIQQLCSEYQLKYIETSAVSGSNVQEAFEQLVRMALKKQEPSTASAPAGPGALPNSTPEKPAIIPLDITAEPSLTEKMKSKCCTS